MKSFYLVSLVFATVLLMTVTAATHGLPEDLADYITWTRANSQKSFEQSMHPVAKDIYFNEAVAASISSGSFPHAEGSIFVKEVTSPETLQVQMLTVMRKVSGFNPDGGDWQYGMFERTDDGTFAGEWMSVEGAAMCSGCHLAAADKDFTFLSYLD